MMYPRLLLARNLLNNNGLIFISIDDNEVEEYKIVGSTEADPFENKISNSSPIAKAIIGKKVNDIASVESPNGSYDVQVVSIK